MNKRLIITFAFIVVFVLVANKSGIFKKLNLSKKMNEVKKNFTESDFTNAVKFLKSKGVDFITLAKIEQLYRLETNHFKSGQYKGTGTGGMETKAGMQSDFPFGWSSLQKFKDSTGIVPAGIHSYVDNQTKKTRSFVVFNSVSDAIQFFIYFIFTIRNGQYWKWNTLDEQKGLEYKKAVDSMKYPIVKQIFNK